MDISQYGVRFLVKGVAFNVGEIRVSGNGYYYNPEGYTIFDDGLVREDGGKVYYNSLKEIMGLIRDYYPSDIKIEFYK